MADDINTPMIPMQIVDRNGNLTTQAYEFFRRLWSRTGYAPGVSADGTAGAAADAMSGAEMALLLGVAVRSQSDVATVRSDTSAFALMVSNIAATQARTQEALDAATLALARVTKLEADLRNVLDRVGQSAIFLGTAHQRDGSFQDESMAFSAVTRAWPFQPKSS